MYPLLEDHSNGFYIMNEQTLTLHSTTKFGTLEFHSQDRKIYHLLSYPETMPFL